MLQTRRENERNGPAPRGTKSAFENRFKASARDAEQSVDRRIVFYSLRFRLLFDVFDDVADALELLHIFLFALDDADVECLFQIEDQLDDVKRVGPLRSSMKSASISDLFRGRSRAAATIALRTFSNTMTKYLRIKDDSFMIRRRRDRRQFSICPRSVSTRFPSTKRIA